MEEFYITWLLFYLIGVVCSAVLSEIIKNFKIKNDPANKPKYEQETDGFRFISIFSWISFICIIYIEWDIIIKILFNKHKNGNN